MKKVFLFGYYGFKNAGDEAILKSIIEALKREIEDIEINVLTYNYKFTKEQHGINPISRSKVFKIISTIMKSDYVISGGGTLIQNITSSKSLYFYLTLVLISKIFGKKVIFYSSGFGPIFKKHNKFLTRLIMKMVDLIELRDYDSKELLDELGVTKNVNVAADAAFGLENPTEDEADKLMKLYELGEKDFVIFAPRDWHNGDRIVNSFAETIDMLENMDFRTVLLPMKHRDDVDFCNEIYKACKHKPIIIDDYLTPKEIRAIISKAKFLVGVRLHALIFGVQQGVPVIGIEYDPKIKGFLDMTDQINVGKVVELTSDKISNKIRVLLDNYDEIKETTLIKNRELTAILKKSEETITDFIKENGNR